MTCILEHLTFSTLNEEQKAIVRAYVHDADLSKLDIQEIFQSQLNMEMPLAFWDDYVNKLQSYFNAANLELLTNEEMSMYCDELSFAFYLFMARYKLALTDGLGHALPDYQEQIEKCIDLMNLFKKTPEKPILNLPKSYDNGLENSLNWMSDLNYWRLYMVWAGAGGLLGCGISFLPNDFFFKLQALQTLGVSALILGSLSWGLYYLRGSVRLIALFIRSFNNDYCSDEEKKLPWFQRFSMQWHKLKFDLINDFFWATGNLACFFWLCGTADFYGGVVTTVLLVMDIAVTLWAYFEAKAQYDHDIKQFDIAIQIIKSQETGNHLQLHALQQAKRQCKIEWDYKLYSLYADVLYAISLMLAFTLLYSCFLPMTIVPASSALILGVVGTVLCFTLNACFAALKQMIDICKSVEMANGIAESFSASNQNEFHLNLLKSEWIYHTKLIEYKKACLLRSVLVELLLPPLIFSALVFTPLYVGILAIMAGIALAIWSKYHIDANYEHDVSCMPTSDSVKEVSDNPVKACGFFAGMNELFREKEGYYEMAPAA